MRFSLCLIDPPGYKFGHFLFDACRMIQGGLQDLGHDCAIRQNVVEKGRVNILLGVHHVASPAWVTELHASRVPYVVMQTEILDPGRINKVRDDGWWDRVFTPLVKGAVRTWDSSEPNLAVLRALGAGADALEWGYTHAIEEVRHRADKDVDFFFYGSVTPHRREVLTKLDELGYRVEVCFDQLAFYRNDLLARAEVLLTLRQSEAMAHLPWARILYGVANRCLIAGESGLGQEPIADTFLWTEPKDVIELLRETRARADRRALAEQFHDRMTKRPMSAGLEPLVKAIAERL